MATRPNGTTASGDGVLSKTARRKSAELKTQAPEAVRTPTADDIRGIAQTALIEVANDRSAQPASRAAAARTLLELVGAIGRLQAPQRPETTAEIASMSRDELLAELAERRAQRAAK